MAWNIEERFPSWGETGAFPPAGFFYEGGDQVNEKHLDALWNGLNGLEEDVQAALSDIDSDGDGKVDNADTIDGEHASAFADDPHGNAQHNTDFTTLSEVNNNADVPNADYADNAGQLGGSEPSAYQTPSGVITMWSGSVNNIPNGWTLCDGSDGTPDLTGRFIVGAGGQYSVGNTGGVEQVQLSVSEIPSHTHTISPVYSGDNTDDSGLGHGNVQTTAGELETESTGGGGAHENRPPYFALAYIMKV